MAWSANAVTWLGSALMWLLLAGVVLTPQPLRVSLAPLWVVLLWSYCVLDHVDGCRARRRRSSSAWGEFLDHALDAWHGAIAVFSIGALSGGAMHPGVIVVTIAAVGLATVATWLEQKLRGEFFLSAIGPVEGIVAVGVFLALWAWPPAAAVLRSPAAAAPGLTWADLALLAGAAGSLFTVAIVARRSRGVAGHLAAAMLITGAMLGLGAHFRSGWVTVGVAIGIFTAGYSARVIASHLTRSPMPWPDVVGLALLGLAAAWPTNFPAFAGAGVLWLAGRAVLTWRDAAQKMNVPRITPPVGLALEVE